MADATISRAKELGWDEAVKKDPVHGAIVKAVLDTTSRRAAEFTAMINGVTAFWVRARIASIGVSVNSPYQGNRRVYTCTWPFVELQADQVGGDIPALARIIVANKSDAASGSPVLHTNRLLIASRPLSRGENFTPFLNIADEQNPSGVTARVGAKTTFEARPGAPAGPH